jgi:hypothetical protein
MTLTDPDDVRKWRRVNYGRGLFGGGVGVGSSGDDGNEGMDDGRSRGRGQASAKVVGDSDKEGEDHRPVLVQPLGY